MHRISVRCKVECLKCGWKSQRHIHVLAKSTKAAEQEAAGQESYRHLGCSGKVLVKNVLGSHKLQ